MCTTLVRCCLQRLQGSRCCLGRTLISFIECSVVRVVPFCCLCLVLSCLTYCCSRCFRLLSIHCYSRCFRLLSILACFPSFLIIACLFAPLSIATGLSDSWNVRMLPGLQRDVSLKVADILHDPLLDRYQETPEPWPQSITQPDYIVCSTSWQQPG
jgi:hypothetical protein